jgi:FkbH-like protein
MPPANLKSQLDDALGEASPRAALEAFVHLAQPVRGQPETVQLDHARRRLSADVRAALISVRLAVLGSSTVDHLLPAIRVGGLRHRFWIETYRGPYGQYRQELLGGQSALSAFSPEVILLSATAAEVLGPVPLSASRAEADAALDRAVAEIQELWQRAGERFGATVIQQSLLDVSEPVFGSFDRLVPGAPARLVARLNDRLADAASASGVLWLDVSRAAAQDGLDVWFDAGQWRHAKIEIAVGAAPRYGELVARVIAARRGQSRKCLVLDLDNTLWGGVLGDDGPDGILLGEGSATGEAHLALQRYAKTLSERGVILAVCSRNDPGIVESVFREHPEMALRPGDIAAFAVNWNDKVANLEWIAEELNIGLDSMVFVDDNPFERARVREGLPMVAVPELPDDPSAFVRTLARAGYFEAVGFTAEDRDRTAHYAANLERQRLRGASTSVEDFLRGLNMTVSFGPVSAIEMNRAAQLINKTNQFNTAGRRYSIDELRAFCDTPGNVALQFRLADRFGDNGLVSVVLLRRQPGEGTCLDVDCWVMSCRVFGRQLEQEVMNLVVEAAARAGIVGLTADYVPTARNGVIGSLFADLGFSLRETTDAGISRWRLEVGEYVPRQTSIAREAQPA